MTARDRLRPYMELGAIFEKWRELRYRSGSSRIECFDEGDFTRSFGIREAYRELVHRPLTAEQAKRWTAQLRKLESEFKADVGESFREHARGREKYRASFDDGVRLLSDLKRLTILGDHK